MRLDGCRQRSEEGVGNVLVLRERTTAEKSEYNPHATPIAMHIRRAIPENYSNETILRKYPGMAGMRMQMPGKHLISTPSYLLRVCFQLSLRPEVSLLCDTDLVPTGTVWHGTKVVQRWGHPTAGHPFLCRLFNRHGCTVCGGGGGDRATRQSLVQSRIYRSNNYSTPHFSRPHEVITASSHTRSPHSDTFCILVCRNYHGRIHDQYKPGYLYAARKLIGTLGRTG